MVVWDEGHVRDHNTNIVLQVNLVLSSSDRRGLKKGIKRNEKSNNNNKTSQD